MGDLPIGEVVCGDCFPWLAGLPGACAQAVIVDPPYGTGTAAWDMDPPPEVWQELRRCCPEGPLAIWGYPECHLRWARHFDGLQVIGSVAWWHYNHPTVCPGLTRHWQQIVIWGRSRKQVRAGDVREPYVREERMAKFNHTGCPLGSNTAAVTPCHPDGRRMTDLWRIPTPGAGFNSHLRQHPNEKPMEACERLVRLLTAEGETVLDCYAGSGPVPAAAVIWGREFLAAELDPGYCEVARRRIAKARRALQPSFALDLSSPAEQPAPA